jgi:CheY-like chemotaxis protein
LEIVELVNTMMMIKILIVEDQIITAMDMRMKLEDAGYEVTDIISFGEDVLQSVKANEPNLVLLDIGLAGKMNGIEAAKSIAEFDLPIIFLTAFNDKSSVGLAGKLNHSGFMAKPILNNKLFAAVEQALGSN